MSARRVQKRRRLEAMPVSSGAFKLLQKVGSGDLHVSTATSIAEDCVEDGCAQEAVNAIAGLNGDSHAERNLHIWLGNLYGSAPESD